LGLSVGTLAASYVRHYNTAQCGWGVGGQEIPFDPSLVRLRLRNRLPTSKFAKSGLNSFIAKHGATEKMWRVGVRIMVIVTAAAVATSAQHPPANAVQWTAVTGDYLESETVANKSFSHEDVLRLDSGVYLVVHGLRDHLSTPPQSAVDRFTISSASVLHSDMWINPDAVVTISHSKTSRARKAIPTGVRTVLAVLVEDGAAHLPQLITSSADLSDRVFGTSGSTFNAKSQFTACSHGAVTLVPGTGTNVVDGVIQVVANTYVAGSKLVDTMNTVMPALNAKLGGAGAESTYDLIMLILPGEDFVASAFVGGTVSQFGGGATTHVSTHMHEIGHNFRLAHANENGEEYDDTTGVMGYATSAKSNSNRGPRRKSPLPRSLPPPSRTHHRRFFRSMQCGDTRVAQH
jgi:hypothetical protein